MKLRRRTLVSFALVPFIGACIGYFVLFPPASPAISPSNIQKESVNPPHENPSEQIANIPEPFTETEVQDIHQSTPEEVRGFYWTAVTAGSEKRRNELISYAKQTGLNAVVIDLKMDNGQIAFEPTTTELTPFVQKNPAIENLDNLLEILLENQIYRIARIPIMRDNILAEKRPDLALKYTNGALWRDKHGIAWLDPAATEIYHFAILLAKEAYDRGFDEVQFDYIRFPSDGAISAIRYPVFNPAIETKKEVMNEAFKQLGEALQEYGAPVSFDLFGMTYVTTSDMNIGQTLAGAYPYADYISPMTYPSHYPNGFHGYQNPALAPYEVVQETLNEGARILENQFTIPQEESRKKTRPWIQDFDIGAVYTAERIEAQIRAVRDEGGSGFLLWNARNVYEPAQYIRADE